MQFSSARGRRTDDNLIPLEITELPRHPSNQIVQSSCASDFPNSNKHGYLVKAFDSSVEALSFSEGVNLEHFYLTSIEQPSNHSINRSTNRSTNQSNLKSIAIHSIQTRTRPKNKTVDHVPTSNRQGNRSALVASGQDGQYRPQKSTKETKAQSLPLIGFSRRAWYRIWKHGGH